MQTVTSNKPIQRYRWARKTPFFYGWVIISLASLSMFATTPGQSDSFSIFMDSFVNEFGWSRTFISTLFSGATLLSGGLMFFAGRIVDRIGAKWGAIGSAAILGAACVLLSLVASPFMLFMGFLLARFSGKGSLDLSASTLAPQWFIKRRAFSIMLVSLGGTAGGVIFPLLNTYLIATYGWREAYRFLAGGLWFIFIPLALFFLISRPEEAGLLPDNKRASKDDSLLKESTSTYYEDEEVSFTQSQALRTSAFWIVTLSVFQASLVGTGVTLHFVSIFRELHYSMTFAAQILSIKPLVAFSTVVLAGLALDKIRHQHYVLAFASLVQAGGFIMLTFINSALTAYLYALVSGFSGALMAISVGVLKPNLFGRRYLAGILGVLMAINVIGSAIGPIVFGAAFDMFNSYREVILLSSLLPFISAGLSLMIRKPEIQKVL